MSRRHLYTIAPNAPFLPMLADHVLDGTLLHGWERTGPFWLSDVTIILPTRRARLKLAEIFAERLGGAALLPDIRTFGGENAEEEPFLPPVDAPEPPPAVGMLERRLILSHMVAAFARAEGGFATPPNAAEIFRLSDSLGELIDDLAIEGVRPAALEQIVVGDIAANWQEVLAFLRIALDAWPKLLAERGKVDTSAARNARLMRQAATAAALYEDRPVIAAGSTGSVPATGALLKAIAALPRGAVVLPGLDTSLSAEDHERLITGATLQGHPQYGLAKLLRALDAGIADVEELARESARTLLVRAAMAPAEATAGWTMQRDAIDVAAAMNGVGIIAAPNVDMEGRAVALAARQAVAEHKSVGIISRDQNLARRIAAELGRHKLEPDDPAGTPLFQSAAGRLCRQLIEAATSRFAPEHLIALLGNRSVTLGFGRKQVRNWAARIDRLLRDRWPGLGLAGVRKLVFEEHRALLDKLEAALLPLNALIERDGITAKALADTLVHCIGAVAPAGELLPGLVELKQWQVDLAAADDGAPFGPQNLDGVLAALMAGAKVAAGERRRDDVFIWGELEARLQSPDLLIVAGLNEDIWPAPAEPGPWMSRAMRMSVGLEPPERKQGQAAHDFEMAMGNARVILAYARRIGSAPSLPSPLLQRLDAFVGEDQAKALREAGQEWIEDAAAMDYAGPPRPAPRPAPTPKADERPRRISVTEVETLMRSPYDIYAKHVLKLQRLAPLGAEPSARERGTMIHKVFERFVVEGLSFSGAEALGRMEDMAREAFDGLDMIPERREIWLRRFRRAGEMFLEWERQRHSRIGSRAAEIKGTWTPGGALQNFVLVGKADRIDRRTDGLYEILDFKTGGVPSAGDMKAYEAPQLLLEAAMVRAGAFPDVTAGDTAALTYLKVGLGPAALQTMPFRTRDDIPVMEAAGEIWRRTQAHIEAFLMRGDLAMPPRLNPRPETGRRPRPGDYDHLARTDEWTLISGVDDPPS
jgi:ATP-dependent helicase/nuclease subunit B